MIDYNNLKNVSNDELIDIIKKLNEGMDEMSKSNRNLISENLYFKKECDKYEQALNSACEELARAYKKHSEKPKDKWLKPENWVKKYVV